MLFFASYTAAVVHVLLYNWRDLANGYRAIRDSLKKRQWFRSSREDFTDIHNRLMREYDDCPESWYLALLAVAFILACVSTLYYDTGFPVWGIFLAIAFSFTLQVPLGIIMAMTNSEITLNVVAELIAGYALAGKPIANMIFKMFGYVATAQSIQFLADLKLAHYTKIPPRLVFAAQLWATVWGGLTSIGVNDWQLSNIEGICTPEAADHMTCPGEYLSCSLLFFIFITSSSARNLIRNQARRSFSPPRSSGASSGPSACSARASTARRSGVSSGAHCSSSRSTSSPSASPPAG